MTKDYFILNNMLNVLVEGQIPLHYDREALEEYLNTEIRDNLKTFDSIDEKLDYLISHDYIDESVLSIYGENNREFVKSCLSLPITMVLSSKVLWLPINFIISMQ